MEKNEFREDLFYRLNVVRIYLPPLRDRLEDIPLLVDYFLSKNADVKSDMVVPQMMLDQLQQHDWPGNVRELENAIQRVMVMTKGNSILFEALPPEIITATGTEVVIDESVAALSQKLFQLARHNPDFKIIPAVERELIINALRETESNQVKAAKLLGITRATLRKRIEKFGIKQELMIE